jgi:hypothetical protein
MTEFKNQERIVAYVKDWIEYEIDWWERWEKENNECNTRPRKSVETLKKVIEKIERGVL